MKSTEFLQAAIDVQAERGKQYDKPTGERSMGATISAFNCITGYTLEESDGWMLLGLLKLVRQSQNPEQYHHDSALDFVAYASLYAEAASEQCGQVEDPEYNFGGDDPREQPSHIISDIPSWDDAPSWAMWLAQDGVAPFAWVFYEYEPTYSCKSWLQRGGRWENTGPAREPANSLETLIQRPARTAQ